MNPNRSVFLALVLLALAGLLAATYVFVTHSLGQPLICPFATGCDAVQDSPYSVIYGIPVSLLGMLGFAAYLALAIGAWRTTGSYRGYLLAIVSLSLVEVGFTAYMAYLQINVIRAICSWCMLSAGITVALAVLAMWAFLAMGLRAGTSGRVLAR